MLGLRSSQTWLPQSLNKGCCSDVGLFQKSLIMSPMTLEKWFPLQGKLAHSLKKFVFETSISIQIKSKSNPNQIHSLFCSSSSFLFQGQPELCGGYNLLQSCFSSISMTNLSCLVAASFSSLALLISSVFTANLSCLLATTFSSHSFLSNSFSSPHVNP